MKLRRELREKKELCFGEKGNRKADKLCTYSKENISFLGEREKNQEGRARKRESIYFAVEFAETR